VRRCYVEKKSKPGMGKRLSKQHLILSLQLVLSINQLMALLAFIGLYLVCWVQAGQHFNSDSHGTVKNSTAATIFALEVCP
jgi:hypothetical protein